MTKLKNALKKKTNSNKNSNRESNNINIENITSTNEEKKDEVL